MALTVTGKYLGKKKVELQHGPTGSTILTDAPKDNFGDGSTFSPTDLVAAALGSCMLTVMGIVADRQNINMTGATMIAQKTMGTDPRRISELPVEIHLPKALTPEHRALLERAAHTCPVHRSLHPDIVAPVSFIYDVE